MTTTLLTFATENYTRLTLSRLFAENILLLLLQMIGIKFCLLSPSPLPIDFAAGTAVGFVFLRGYTILPGIWLGTVLACLTGGFSFSKIVWLASAYTMQTGLLFWLVLRFIGPGLYFIKRQLYLRYIAICSTLALIFSPFFYTWQADLLALIIIPMTIHYWDMYFPEIKNRRVILNFLPLLGLLLAALLINVSSLLSEVIIFPHNVLNNICLFFTPLCVFIIFCSIQSPDMK